MTNPLWSLQDRWPAIKVRQIIVGTGRPKSGTWRKGLREGGGGLRSVVAFVSYGAGIIAYIRWCLLALSGGDVSQMLSVINDSIAASFF